MKSFPSIRSRLLFILFGLGLSLVALGGVLYFATESLFYQGLKSELGGDVAWLESMLLRDPTLLQPAKADSICKGVSRFKNYRVTLVDFSGQVLADSHIPSDSLTQLENHAQRPEIEMARREGYGYSRRFSQTVGMEMLYVSKSIGTKKIVVRMAAGSETLHAFRREATKTLIGVLFLFFAAAGLSMLWMSRQISEPLLRLAVDARDITRPLRWDAKLREAEVLNQAFSEYLEAIRKLTADLRSEHNRLTSVLNRLDEGIVLLSPEGHVVAVNPAARRLLPVSDVGVGWEGQSISNLISHSGLKTFLSQSGGDSRLPFFQVERESDSTTDLLCHLRALGSDAQEMLLTVIDVTEFRNLDRAKSDFVANASHELKTPLSSILGYSETLLDGALAKPEACEPFVRKIHDNALRLQRLVQDLLSLSQIESQSLPRHAEPLPVRSYLQAASQLVRSEMDKQGIRFENHVPVGLFFRMEPKDLELICNNLISNAVRYNHSGGKVKVTWDELPRLFSVKDTGIGISQELMPRIFERFYRADASRSRKDGTGLGLAIVKHAAQRYGINVTVESQVGVGSAFLVEIPVEILAVSLEA